MTPDNIAPNLDYQRQRLEAGAFSIIFERLENKWIRRLEAARIAELVLKAADAVTRPTQPEVMSAEEFAKQMYYTSSPSVEWWTQWVKQRDEAIRKSERENMLDILNNCDGDIDFAIFKIKALTNYESGEVV